MLNHFDLTTFVSTLGYLGVLTIITLETALFFCFFFPGDSLLFAAGYLAARGVFKLSILIPGVAAAAFIGYTIAYFFGVRLGNWLLNQKESMWYKRKYVDKAHQFYNYHGGKAVLLGRLVPILRTFVPIVAGMARMPYRRYTTYNLCGAVLWATIVPTAGFYLGTLIPASKEYILPGAIVVVFLSISPAIIKWLITKYKNR